MSFLDLFKVKQYKATIEQLQIRNNELTSQVENLQSFIHTRLPLFDTNTISTPNEETNLQDIWNNYWKFVDHNSFIQSLHQQRACSAAMTPLVVNTKSGCANFKGEEDVYETTLTSCQCMNFKRYLKPCKHIYRLAHELEVYQLPAPVESVSEPCKILRKSELVRIKQQLSDNSLELLYGLKNSNGLVVSYKEAEQLLRLGLAIIDPNKYKLLNSFKKDVLISMFPTGTPGIKSAKKVILIEKLISDYPNAILEIERHTVGIKLSPYASRL